MFSKSQIITLIRNKDLSESGIEKIIESRDFENDELIEILLSSLKSGYFKLSKSILLKTKETVKNYPTEFQNIKKITFGNDLFEEIINEIEGDLNLQHILLEKNHENNFHDFLEKVNLNLRSGYRLSKAKNLEKFTANLSFLDNMSLNSIDLFTIGLKRYLEIHTDSLNLTQKDIIRKISGEGSTIEDVVKMEKPVPRLRERMDGSMYIDNEKEVFLYEHKIELNQIENIKSSPYFLYANKQNDDFFIGKHYYKDAIISYTSPLSSYIRYSENRGFKYADLVIKENKYDQIYVRSDTDKKNYIELDKDLSIQIQQIKSIEKKESGLAEISNLLSGNQDLLFRSPTHGVVLIEGVSGSGKTNLIFHRIDYLIQEFPEKFKKDKIAIFVKNGYLQSYMKNTLKNTEFIFKEFIQINLIDGFLRENLIKYTNLSDWPVVNNHTRKIEWTENINDIAEKFMELNSENLKTFEIRGKYNIDMILEKWYKILGKEFKEFSICYEELILIAYLTNEINKKLYDYPLFKYDYVLVDEFQDFSFNELSFLIKAFGNSLVFSGDFTQSVIHSKSILQNLGTEIWQSNPMTDNFRNSYEIVKFATEIFSEQEKQNLLLAKRVIRTGSLPTIFDSINIEEVASKLNMLINESIVENKKLAIIYHDFKYIKQIYEKLETKIIGMFPQLEKINLDDFYNSKIYFLSYRESKGLEFDNVVLVDPQNLLKGNDLGSKKLFYIGATRAVFNLYLFSGKNYFSQFGIKNTYYKEND